MTKLKSSKKLFLSLFEADLSPERLADRNLPNSKETAEFSRFKAQIKRAVDSAEAPQYLIDAIKIAIRS